MLLFKALDIAKMENELFDVPKVVFADLELLVIVGQWLGILLSRKVLGILDLCFIHI